MTESPAAIERSDVCAVPAAAVVGEAMVAIVLADAAARKVRRRLDATSCVDELRSVPRAHGGALRTRLRAALRASDLAMIRPILKYGDARPARAGRGRSTRSRRTSNASIDDMVETMYAAPGIGLAAPQVGVPLRIFVVDISVGRDPTG